MHRLSLAKLKSLKSGQKKKYLESQAGTDEKSIKASYQKYLVIETYIDELIQHNLSELPSDLTNRERLIHTNVFHYGLMKLLNQL